MANKAPSAPASLPASASASASASANGAVIAAGKSGGAIKVVNPDQNGNFAAPVAHSAVDKVQVVDVDMVLQLKDGSNVVLAGGAIGAMDASHAAVKFTDTAEDLSHLLDLVGVIDVPKFDPIISSLQAPPNTEGQGNGGEAQADASNHAQVASLTSQIVNQLTQIVATNSQSVTIQATAPSGRAEINLHTGDADTQPLQHVEPPILPEKPGVIPQEHVIGPDAPKMTLSLVNLTTIAQVGNVLYGSGGIPSSATDSSNAAQFAPQVINAPANATEIHAVGDIPPNDFIKVVNMQLTGDGIAQSITVKGVPAGMEIANGTDLGGGNWSIAVVSGQRSYDIQLEYTTTVADPNAPIHSQFSMEFDVTLTTADGIVDLAQVKQFVVKDVNSANDLTFIDSTTGQSVYVLPAQGNSHIVHGGDGGVTIYGGNAADFLFGGAGADTINGGSGNTYFEGGGGADHLNGGIGVNTVGYTLSANGVTVNLATGTGSAGDAAGDVLVNISNVIGSTHNDIIVSGSTANNIDGGGHDAGGDTVSYAASNAAVTIDLSAGTGTGGYAAGDKYTNIQNVTGSTFDDKFFASSDANAFDGGGHGVFGDIVSYANDGSGTGVVVDLAHGTGSGGLAQGDTYTNIQGIIGTVSNDTFIDGAGANTYEGNGGNDTVSYAFSNVGVSVDLDQHVGSGGFAAGDKYSNIQNVIGSAFDDVFIAGHDSKSFNGGSGGIDEVSYAASDAAVTIDAINNQGFGGYAQGNTYASIEKFVGSSQSDTFIASATANIFDGGNQNSGGSDTVDYSHSTTGVTVDLSHSDGTGTSGGYAQGDVLVNISNVIGSSSNDTFVANAAQNSFVGGGGIDTVSYAQSSTGGVTVDLFYTDGTGTGDAFAFGDKFSGISNLIGSSFNDTFVASNVANAFDGGSGSNTVSYIHALTGVSIDLSTPGSVGAGGAAGDTFTNIQNLTGSNFDDSFIASNVANAFDGGAGNDTVSYAGTAGDNSIDLKTVGAAATGTGFANGDTYANIENVTGGTGNDVFYASAAANKLDGSGGINTVDYSKSTDAFGVIVDLFHGTGSGNGAGNAALGDAAGDIYTNIQNAVGTSQNDEFIANNVANAFDGKGGAHNVVSYEDSTAAVNVNLITGLGANGDASGDTYANIQDVTGGSGNDTFIASTAANNFDGGVGVDTVSYAGTAGDNTIDLKTVGALATGNGSAQGDTYVNIENVTGGTGNDLFYASAAANKFDGDGGTNTVDYSKSTDGIGVVVDLFHGTGSGNGAGNAALSDAAGDTYVNIQNATGTAQDDKFVANSAVNAFDGQGGAHNMVSYEDSTTGVTVNLNLTTGQGSNGDAAGDTYVNIQDATGGSGNDTFIANNVANNFDGGAGVDTVTYAGTAGDNTIDLKTAGAAGTGTGYANGDTYANIENVTGGAGNDLFYASAAANKFDGDGGNNTVDYSKSADAFGVIVDLVNNVGSGNGAGHAALGDAAGDTYANIQNATGTAQDDQFIASNVANKFDGGAGNDTVSYAGTAGDNTIDLKTAGAAATGAGFASGDTYTNIENVTGGAGNDLFYASAVANKFDGDGGNNTVDYSKSTDGFGVIVDLLNQAGSGNGAGNATLGDAAGDTYANIQNVTGTAQDDQFVASNVANKFDGGAGNDTVSYAGTAGDNSIDLKTPGAAATGTGYANGDTYANIENVIGGAGNDTFFASAVANKFDGDGGNNTVDYSKSTDGFGVMVDLIHDTGAGNGAGNAALGDAAGDTYANIQNATGTGQNDLFTANNVANKFDGGAGIDTVTYAGTAGDNRIDLKTPGAAATGTGYANGDTYANIENVVGGSGNDTFFASAVANKFDGDGGNNTVDYSKSTDAFGVIVDLVNNVGSGNGVGNAALGDAAGDTYLSIQNATGSAQNDKFIANSVINVFDGKGGTHNMVSYEDSTAAVSVNLITGQGTLGDAQGDTYVNIQDAIGGTGNDTFIASNVANAFDGGAGADTVTYAGTAGNNSIDLKTAGAAATGTGFANGDTYANIENVTGGAGNDTFFASAAANKFDGDGGNNTVDYSKSTDAFGVIVDLVNNVGSGNGVGNAALGDAAGDTYLNIQNVTGSSHSDIFIANGVANAFDGGGGSHNRVSYQDSTAAVTINLSTGLGSGGDAASDTYVRIQDATGGAGDDTFFGNASANAFDGGAGTDTVSYAGSAGNNSIDLKTVGAAATGTGAASGDTYTNIENIIGGAGSDTFFASAVANKFDGNGGNNTVDYSKSADGFGVIVDLVNNVGSGNGVGNAALGDAAGDTYLNIQNATGTSQNDKFIANGVANVFDGNGGTHNLVSYEDSTAGVTVNLSTTTGTGTGGDAQGDSYINIQDVTGGTGDDTFVAGTAANNFDGGAGSDTIDYSAATAAITVNLSSGAAGAGDARAAGDTYANMENIIGGSANDILTGATLGNSTLTGGAGADTLTGLGINNTASYKGSAAAVTVDLTQTGGAVGGSGGDAQGDILTNIQNLIGSSNSDLFYASVDANKFDGGAGGSDTVSYQKQDLDGAITTGVTVDLSTGAAAATGGYAIGDTFVNIHNLIGTQFVDHLTGASGGGSTLTGGGGADVLIGQGFNAGNVAATANTADYTASGAGVTVDLVSGTGLGGDAQGDTLSGIQNLVGSSSNDTFIIAASAQANTVDGGSNGSDTVSYAHETSAVTVDLSAATGLGYTTSVGASGVHDTLLHIQNATGGSGDDSFIAGLPGNFFDGGAGSDTVDYHLSSMGAVADSHNLGITGVVVDFSANTGSGNWAAGDTYANMENVIGSAGNDLFISNDLTVANKYDGGSGGSDTVSYEHASTSFQASLLTPGGNTGDALGDTYSHIGNLMGSAVDGVTSTLSGDGFANTLTALGANTINILNGGGASSGSDILDGRLGGTNTLNAGDVGDTIFQVGTDGSGNLASNIVAGGVHGSSAAGTTATMKIFGMVQGIALNMHSFNGHADHLTVVDLKDGVNTDITIDYNDVVALGKGSGGVNGTELTLNLDDHDSVSITDVAGEHWKFFGNGDYVFYADTDPNNTTALATLHTRPTS